MNPRWSRILPVLVLVAASALLYVRGLAWSPPYLSIEEVGQTTHAVWLSTTGRNLNGQWLPLYFPDATYTAGRDPLWIYATAGLLKLQAFSETLVRLPSASAGVLAILLMFWLARRVLGDDLPAFVAAGLLALTPAHFIESRIATNQIATVPFVLTWLLFLAIYLDSNRPRDVLIAAACLGLSVYSYLSALVMAPIYFGATLVVVIWHERSRPRTPTAALAAASVGFAAALLPAVLWHIAHPERIAQLLDYYTHGVYNNNLGAKSFLSLDGVAGHLNLWWNCFSPGPLFLGGDASFRFSTRQAGHFLLPIAALLVPGAVHVRRHVKPELQFLLAAGLILGPLPAVLANEFEIKRCLNMVPIVVLIAACGVQHLWTSRQQIRRAIAVTLVALCVFQFVGFYRYYWGAYRIDSQVYFGGNLRGAIQEVLADARDPGCVFIDRQLYYIESQWPMYTRAYGRNAFADRAHLLDPEQLRSAEASFCRSGSVMMLKEGAPATASFVEKLAAEGWLRAPIAELDGAVNVAVYRQPPR